MELIITFIQKAIGQGIAILFGATGEIATEKSGNLNLGIPGIMYMGGISGLMGSFFCELGHQNPSPGVGALIAVVCTLVASALGGLIYSVLTITLRANQNVVGLALTTFGTGFGNFFGGSISKLAGGVGQISVMTTASAFQKKIPGLSELPVIGPVFFSYGFLTYLSIVLSVLMFFATVYIQAHYLIDALAGLLSGVLFYILFMKLSPLKASAKPNKSQRKKRKK